MQFWQLPNVRATDLTIHDRLTLGRVLIATKHHQRISIRRIQQKIGLNPKAIAASLRKLRQQNWITAENQPVQRDEYRWKTKKSGGQYEHWYEAVATIKLPRHPSYTVYHAGIHAVLLFCHQKQRSISCQYIADVLGIDPRTVKSYLGRLDVKVEAMGKRRFVVRALHLPPETSPAPAAGSEVTVVASTTAATVTPTKPLMTSQEHQRRLAEPQSPARPSVTASKASKWVDRNTIADRLERMAAENVMEVIAEMPEEDQQQVMAACGRADGAAKLIIAHAINDHCQWLRMGNFARSPIKPILRALEQHQQPEIRVPTMTLEHVERCRRLATACG